MKVTLDIGGSKTRGFVYDGGTVENFEIFVGFGLAIDGEELLTDLQTALLETFQEKTGEVEAVAVNLGGKKQGANRKDGASCISKRFISTTA